MTYPPKSIRYRIAGFRAAAAMMVVTAALMAALPRPARAAGNPSPARGFKQVGRPRALAGAPGIHEWSFVAQRGPSGFDRVGLHHIATGSKASPAHPGPVMLYLPGTNMNGEIVPDDPRYSLPLYLASHGVDVWTMDYRTHFVPPDTPPADLGEMAGWSDGVFAGDVNAAAGFIRIRTHRNRLFVAGFSRGAGFAYLFAAMHPRRVAGLVILDGFISVAGHRAKVRPTGRVADDIAGRHLTWAKRQALMEAVIHNPDGPAPLKKYRTARENLAQVVYHAGGIFGGHGGLANPLGGFSDPIVLARVLVRYDRWWPAVQDYENPFNARFVARLKASKIPVLAFSSTNISHSWPVQAAESARATGSADVTFKRLTGWGHLDVICGTRARSEVYEPVLAWLMRHRK